MTMFWGESPYIQGRLITNLFISILSGIEKGCKSHQLLIYTLMLRRERSVNLSSYMLKSQCFYFSKLVIGNDLGTKFNT